MLIFTAASSIIFSGGSVSLADLLSVANDCFRLYDTKWIQTQKKKNWNCRSSDLMWIQECSMDFKWVSLSFRFGFLSEEKLAITTEAT